MKRWLFITLIAVFSVVFLVSGFFLVRYYNRSFQAASDYDALLDIKNQYTPVPTTYAPNPSSSPAPVPTPPPYVEVTGPNGDTFAVLREYAELYNMNSDLVGWLEIPGTRVNYPVVQSPDSPDYYLHKNFHGEYSTHGCLYVQENCDVFAPSDNVVIYGHHMHDGSMLSGIFRYTSKEFWQAHPTFTFDTITEHRTYAVYAIFTTTATQGQGFSYHTFVDADSTEAFDRFADQCARLSYYNTGVTAQYGDSFLTLSTCEYSQVNGRLVLVAKRVS